jgi:hypothetical protein
MKLYRARVPAIAHAVLERLVNEGDVEIDAENRSEAEQDLVAIMEMYLKRDQDLREAVREEMERRGISYDQYGKTRSDVAEGWGHPVGDDIDRFLARQFIENFMISRWISEVFAEDKDIYKKILDVLKANDVDERALRAEAEERIKNIPENSVERQEALNRALKEVRKRHGLVK